MQPRGPPFEARPTDRTGASQARPNRTKCKDAWFAILSDLLSNGHDTQYSQSQDNSIGGRNPKTGSTHHGIGPNRRDPVKSVPVRPAGRDLTPPHQLSLSRRDSAQSLLVGPSRRGPTLSHPLSALTKED